MKDIKIDYAQLLETNNLIQQNADETYWLCATRTVQESKIFPVSAYILFSYLNCFYRFPELLKKIEQEISHINKNLFTIVQIPNSQSEIPFSLKLNCLQGFGKAGRERYENIHSWTMQTF